MLTKLIRQYRDGLRKTGAGLDWKSCEDCDLAFETKPMCFGSLRPPDLWEAAVIAVQRTYTSSLPFLKSMILTTFLSCTPLA